MCLKVLGVFKASDTLKVSDAYPNFTWVCDTELQVSEASDILKVSDVRMASLPLHEEWSTEPR